MSPSNDFIGPPLPPELREPEPVLAEGHLHPGMLFLRFADGLRQSIVPVAVAILGQQPWLFVAAIVLFVFSLGFALIRYLSFRYRLTPSELITIEGIFHRQERRIPVDRVQDLNFESTLLRRLFGLVVVSVETASGQGIEAQLDSLSRRDAESLREVLHHARARRRGEEVTPRERSQEFVLYRATGSELTLLGLTNNRIGALLLAVFGIVELSDELGLPIGEAVTDVFGSAASRVSQFGTPTVALFVIALLFLLLTAGWVLSIAASFVMYHGFALTEREAVLHRRFGLITTRSQSLPRQKIQRVLLEAAPLRRVFGAVTVRADSAGSGMGEDRDASNAGARDVIVPMTARASGERLVPWLLTGLPPEPLAWNPVSPKIVWRIFVKGVLLTTLVLAAGLPSIGPVALLGLLILPCAWLAGILAHRNLGWVFLPDHVAFRWGILGRYRAFVPLQKVQAAVLRAGPIERSLGLARLTVYVAGGSPSTLGNLPREIAERLETDVAQAAARSRFVW